MGKIVFADSILLEKKIQLVFKKDTFSDFEKVIALSYGDLIYISGTKGVTHSGEISLFVESMVEIAKNRSKVTRQQMIKQRARFQNRHIDLALNRESFDFWKRTSLVMSNLRNAMSVNGFSEFNTGILQTTRDAGLASAFTTKCYATGKTYALSMTCELKLKRLIAGGFSRVYEIAQSFRNEGLDKNHMPEFSLMEAYATSWTSTQVSDLLEKIVKSSLSNNIDQNNKQTQFKRITFTDIWKEIVGGEHISIDILSEKFPTLFKPGMPEFTWVYKFICKFVAPGLQEGTFVTELPHGFSPFSNRLETNEQLMDGGILVVDGLHIATYSSDNNDYETVRETLIRQSGECGVRPNEEFLEVLKFGLPPTAGFGLGVNRLLMLVLDKLPRDARETCLYPLL